MPLAYVEIRRNLGSWSFMSGDDVDVVWFVRARSGNSQLVNNSARMDLSCVWWGRGSPPPGPPALHASGGTESSGRWFLRILEFPERRPHDCSDEYLPGIRVRVVTAWSFVRPIVAHRANAAGIPEMQDGENCCWRIPTRDC